MMSTASCVVPPLIPGTDPLRYCRRLLDNMMGEELREIACHFYEPVDAVGMSLHDYHERIRCPMDLGTIKKALDAGQYINAHEFAADVRLMFTNCYRYNHEDHEIIPIARELHRYFELNFARFPEEGYMDAKVRVVRVNKNGEFEDPEQMFGNLNLASKSESEEDDAEDRIRDLEEEIRIARERLLELKEKEKASDVLPAPPVIAATEEVKKAGPKMFLPKRPFPIGISGAKKSKITQQLQRKRQVGERNMLAAQQMVKRSSSKKGVSAKTVDMQQPVPCDDSVENTRSPDEVLAGNTSKNTKVVTYESDEELLPMSYDEKRVLSLEINKLPYEKLLEVVKIVKA